jgi:hypothetical protein
MLKIIIILGAIALGTNALLIWYVKRKNPNVGFKQSRINTVDLGASPQGFLKIKQGRKLIQSAATELGISVEELDNMTFKEIMELAKK